MTEMEADFEQNQADLKLAFKRISDLQAALEEGIESDFSDRWGATRTVLEIRRVSVCYNFHM